MQEIFRKDYKPTAYLIPHVGLDFQLNEDKTRVSSKLQLTPNHNDATPPPLKLDGKRSNHQLYSEQAGAMMVLSAVEQIKKKSSAAWR